MPDPTPPTADAAPVEIEHLVQAIKAEAARLQPDAAVGAQSMEGTASLQFVANSQAAPDPSEAVLRRIELALSDAQQQAQGSLRWPERFSRFPFSLSRKLQDVLLRAHGFLFKKQKVVNLDLLAALNEVTVLLRAQTHNHLTLQQQHEKLQRQVENQATDNVEQSLQATVQLVQGLELRYQETTEWLTNLGGSQAAVEDALKGLSAGQTQLQEWMNQLESGHKQTEVFLQAIHHRQGLLESSVQSIQGDIQQFRKALDSFEDRISRDLCMVKESTAQQQRLLRIQLAQADKSELLQRQDLDASVAANNQLSADISAISHQADSNWLDPLYAAFEDKFRGSRNEIKQRLEVYEPYVQRLPIQSGETAILDVGCGRGEWLELMKDKGYAAMGLDLSRTMIERCRLMNLDAIEADVMTYLQSLEDQTLWVITGFHIIEHLAFEVWIELFDEALRVLQPGGLLILETPNPENITVGACNFYVDPTHRNPIFPQTLQFFLEQRGFNTVELLRLSEHRIQDTLSYMGAEHPDSAQLNPLINIAKQYFLAAPDFAVVAHKG